MHKNRKSGRRDKTKSNLPFAIMNWRYISVLSVSSGCWQWRPVTAFAGVTRKGVHCDPCWPLTIKSGWRVDHYQVWSLRLRVMVTENFFASSVLFTNDIFTWSSQISSRLSVPGGQHKEKSLRNVYSLLTRRLYGFLSTIAPNFSYFIVSTIYELNMPFHQSRARRSPSGKRGETTN